MMLDYKQMEALKKFKAFLLKRKLKDLQ